MPVVTDKPLKWPGTASREQRMEAAWGAALHFGVHHKILRKFLLKLKDKIHVGILRHSKNLSKKWERKR